MGYTHLFPQEFSTTQVGEIMPLHLVCQWTWSHICKVWGLPSLLSHLRSLLRVGSCGFWLSIWQEYQEYRGLSWKIYYILYRSYLKEHLSLFPMNIYWIFFIKNSFYYCLWPTSSCATAIIKPMQSSFFDELPACLPWPVHCPIQ